MPEGFEQAGRLADALEMGTDRFGQGEPGFSGTKLGSRPYLRWAPDLFDRVQVRRVGGQAFEVQARVPRTQRPDQRSLVVCCRHPRRR